MGKFKKNKGFTMIELVVVLVLIGLIAAIAIPKYLDVTTKAKEKSLKGTLSTIRGAVSLNYSKTLLDGAGTYPSLNATIFQDRNLPDDVYTPTNNVIYVTNDPIASGDFTDAGGWLYNITTGEVRANVAGKHDW